MPQSWCSLLVSLYCTTIAADGRGVDRRGGRGGSELEQCMYCLQDFAVLELVAHVSVCPVKDTTEVGGCARIFDYHCPSFEPNPHCVDGSCKGTAT